MTMVEKGWYPPTSGATIKGDAFMDVVKAEGVEAELAMSKSRLYRIKTLAGLNPREEQESSLHAKNLVGSPDAGLGITGRCAPSGGLNTCPGCGGPADNGHDRCIPPSPYFCTACTEAAITNATGCLE